MNWRLMWNYRNHKLNGRRHWWFEKEIGPNWGKLRFGRVCFIYWWN